MTGAAEGMRTAAFFDVDGTLARTTIVHYYVYFRRRQMSSWIGPFWHAAFLLKCLYYLAVDRIDRSAFNTAFYRSYADVRVDEIKARAPDCYRDVIVPRRFVQASDCVAEHRRAGRRIVLVTGAMGYVIEPFASDLGADDLIAVKLIESNGCFTGRLEGPPIARDEKAGRVRRLARERGIDLQQSYAYGDSVSDLAMLEAVGHPQAVNPDRRLAVIAEARGWPIHRWTVAVGETNHS